ncbi:MAG: arsenate reductase [Chloroflexi bacterium RBG_13_54_8]|nr:MAG: arsenate reductase [Chloroflexi bacterium RBG_13_54_8]
MKRVLFVCVHNSGRSQMAESFFNILSKGKAVATSAGTEPAQQANPTVVQAMLEVGIDIRSQKPKPLTLEMIESADRIITMGCGVEGVCPASFVPTEEWELEDPEREPTEKVREIRDETRARVEELVKELQ